MFKIVNTLEQNILDEMLDLAKLAPLTKDVSSYARGRERIWLNANWDLKNKTFNRHTDCFNNERLWSIIKNIWPSAEIGLLTYSGLNYPKGISLHRDDSYADYESWGIQLTGTCDFVYMGGYRSYFWEAEQDQEVMQTHKLNPGDVFKFNCKNRHSAVPSIDRYAINLWKVSKKYKEDYKEAFSPKPKPLF